MRNLLIIFTVIFSGCGDNDLAIGPGMQDFSAPICGDYYILRSSAHRVQVSPLGYGSSTPIIPAKVVELGHDDRFIIAKQNELRRRSPDDPKDTYMEPDPGKFSFWILDTKDPRVYGPFTKQEFDEKRIEIGVSPEMLMKDIYTYRPQNNSVESTH